MSADTKLNNLIINKLTTAKYEELVENDQINDNEFYLTTDTNYPTEEEIETALAGKQNVLTAGTGIDITNNVVSNTLRISWGDILGTVSDQTDLQNALDEKQNTLIAGDNITLVQQSNKKEADTQKYYDYYTGQATDDGNGNFVILSGLGKQNKYLRTRTEFGETYDISDFISYNITTLKGLRIKFKLTQLPIIDDTFSSLIGGAYANFPKTNVKISYNVTNDTILLTHEYYASSESDATTMGTYEISNASTVLLNQWHTFELYKDNNIWHMNVDNLGTESVNNNELILGINWWYYFFICNAYSSNNNQSETNGYFVYNLDLLNTGLYDDNGIILGFTKETVAGVIISADIPTVNWSDINDKPTFAEVATSGDYDDLVNKPLNVSEFTNDANYVTESQLETKQDTLVSGTNIKSINNQSLLGSGNIEIESGSTTAEEIVNANEATGATSPLKVWQGTEQEYNQGEITEWKNWKTDTNVSQASTVNVPFYFSGSNNWHGVKLLGGKHVVSYNGFIYYSDDGVNWASHKIDASYSDYYLLEYRNGTYYAFTAVSGIFSRYASTDLINWTSEATDSTGSSGWYDICYVGNKLFGWSQGPGMAVSDDNGLHWVNATPPEGGYWSDNRGITYVNGLGFYSRNLTNASNFDLWTSTDGTTWTPASITSGTSTYGSYKIAYGNGIYVMICANYSGGYSANARTSVDGVNWSDIHSLNYIIGDSNNSFDSSSCDITFVNGRFLVSGRYNSSIRCSEDGVNWQEVACAGFGRVFGFLPVASNNTAVAYNRNLSSTSPLPSPIILVDKKECYTLDSEPTTSSVIYSEPSVESLLTVTSVGVDSITLSDNYIYNRDTIGDTDTYRNVGEVHPDWICNINSIGVKIDNTLIADNTDTSGLQPLLTAGAGMSIVGNTISTTATTLHKVTNTTVQVSDFVADTQYTGYNYRADVPVTGITANDYPNVIFAVEDCISNNYSRFVESGNGYVSIWCKVLPESAITIPTITYE